MSLLCTTVILSVLLPTVWCQVDLNQSYTIDKMPLRDKALFVADFLMSHPDLFARIEKTFLLLTTSDTAGNFLGSNIGKGLLNFALDVLPALLTKPLFQQAMVVVKDEIDSVNVTDIGSHIMANHLKPGDENYDRLFTERFFPRLNYVRLVLRLLRLTSVRSFLPLNYNVALTDECYSHAMIYLDSLKGGEPAENEDSNFHLNWTVIPWANKMLFSSGLLGDDIDKMNSLSKRCRTVDVSLPAGTILAGNTSLEDNVSFRTDFCNVTFSVPVGIRELFGLSSVKQGNSVSWGLCVPMTCNETDVGSIFKLGYLERFFKVTTVRCGLKPSKRDCPVAAVEHATNTAVTLSPALVWLLLLHSVSWTYYVISGYDVIRFD